MAERVRVRKPAERHTDEVPADQATAPDTAEAKQKAADADALLDEIDELLEDVLGDMTEQEFVAGFVQKGGE